MGQYIVRDWGRKRRDYRGGDIWKEIGDFGDEKQVRVTWRISHFSDGKPVLGFDICIYVL